MPLFFIDTQLDGVLVKDEEGLELTDASAGRKHCTEGLIDIAKHLVAANVDVKAAAILRDEAGSVLVTQELSLTCRVSCECSPGPAS